LELVIEKGKETQRVEFFLSPFDSEIELGKTNHERRDNPLATHRMLAVRYRPLDSSWSH